MNDELLNYMSRYKESFNDTFSLFVVDADPDEAIKTIKECLEQHKTVEELLNITYDEKTLY